MNVKRSLISSTLIVSVLSLIGKLLGLLKNVIIAATFGASATLDAFWVAYLLPFAIPSMVKGVATTVFIPRFMKSLQNARQPEDWLGANTFFTATVVIVALLATALTVFSGPVVGLIAPKLDASTAEQAAEILAYFSIGMVFLGFSAALTSLSYALERFFVPALESITSNLVIILACLLFVDSMGLKGLVIGVVFGVVFQLTLLIIANRHEIRRMIRPAWSFSHPDFKSSSQHVAPLMVGYGGALLMAIVDQAFASTLEAGAISVYSYAVMLSGLPMAVVGESVLHTFYPSLSRHYAQGALERMSIVHMRGLRLLIIIFVPVSVGLILFNETLISLMFERGNFGVKEVELTAMTMAALALGLVFRAICYLNFRIFHAMSRPWIPVTIGLIEVSLNIGLNFLLIDRFGIVGIALATSISGILCAGISILAIAITVRFRLGFLIARRLGALFLLVGAISLICYAGGTFALSAIDHAGLSVFVQRLIELGILALASGLIFAVLVFLKVDEVNHMAAAAIGRIRYAMGR